MTEVLFIIYAAASYWAANQTVYANSVVFTQSFLNLFVRKLITAILLGWILIPVAIIKMVLTK